jgi:hypothetical protein
MNDAFCNTGIAITIEKTNIEFFANFDETGNFNCGDRVVHKFDSMK